MVFTSIFESYNNVKILYKVCFLYYKLSLRGLVLFNSQANYIFLT